MDFFANLDSNAILIGVLSSFTASLLFIIILFRVRPNISVSPYIAKDKDPNTNEVVFVFKVKNNSPFFKIYDLKCSVGIFETIPSHNGEDTKRTDDRVMLINDNYWVLANFNIRHISQWFNREKKLKSRTDYAAQFGTKFDLEKVIADRKVVRVEVFGKHPLSGFSKVKFEEYKHSSEIKVGSFYSGNSFVIK